MTKIHSGNIFEALNFSDAPSISISPPGSKAKELLERQKRVDSKVLSYPHMIPLAPESGMGATVKDVDGNYFIDLSGGIGVLNIGHSNPDVIEAIKWQVSKMIHGLDFPGEARVQLSEKLAKIAPNGLKDDCKIFLCGPTGSDAVEAATKLAKFYTKKRGVISFEGGWHGVSGSGLAATGKKSVKEPFLPVMPEVYSVPYAYCYRCRFGLTYPDCDLQCAKFLEHVIKDADSNIPDPCCVLIEPIQGEGGVVVPPDGYLEEVRRICNETGLLLIMDEIQTGFARTGAMFASEICGVTPDLMPISKTLGGGLPLAAVVIKNSLDTWGPGSHVGTFRGNLLASAAGLATIGVIEKYDLVARSKRLGLVALDRLQKTAAKSRCIGEVRGRGLFIGLEFVKNKESKEPAPDILQLVVSKCFERGVMLWKAGRWNNVGRMMPALVITENHLHMALDIFEQSLIQVEKESF
jgi:diaminobutyrate-2-oxoglutarate transaminase